MRDPRQSIRPSILATFLLVTACGTVNTVSTRTEPATTSRPAVTQVNALLTAVFVKAKDVRVFPTKSGLLEAQIDVANDDFRTRSFNYRFEWLDGSGNLIRSVTAVWDSASIPAGGQSTISSVAPTTDAADFRLQVRASN